MLYIQRGEKLLKTLQHTWRTRSNAHMGGALLVLLVLCLDAIARLVRRHSKLPSGCFIGGLVILISMACALGFAESGAKIILRPEVEIARQRIHLRDIAQIQTDDEKLRPKLESVEIGRTNTSGRPRTITIPHIKSRIARCRLNPSQYTYVGSKSVVRYKEITLSPERILASAEAFYQQFIGERADAELRVEPKMPIRPIRVPDGDVKLKFVPPDRDIWKGTLEAQVIHNGAVINRSNLIFRLLVIRPVVVAARDIPSRAVIKPEFLKLERREIGNPGDLLLTMLDQVIGKRTDVAIVQGEVITASHLKKTYLVPRGSVVTMIVQKGNLKVQTQGKALQNGQRGEFISVMNLISKEKLVGEVIGDKSVRIHF